MRKLLIIKVFLTILLGAIWALAVSAEEASAPATPGASTSTNTTARAIATAAIRLALRLALLVSLQQLAEVHLLLRMAYCIHYFP